MTTKKTESKRIKTITFVMELLLILQQERSLAFWLSWKKWSQIKACSKSFVVVLNQTIFSPHCQTKPIWIKFTLKNFVAQNEKSIWEGKRIFWDVSSPFNEPNDCDAMFAVTFSNSTSTNESKKKLLSSVSEYNVHWKKNKHLFRSSTKWWWHKLHVDWCTALL